MHPATCRTSFEYMTEPMTNDPQNFKSVLIGLPCTLDLRSTTNPIQQSYDSFSSNLSSGKDVDLLRTWFPILTWWRHSGKPCTLFSKISLLRGLAFYCQQVPGAQLCVKTCTVQSWRAKWPHVCVSQPETHIMDISTLALNHFARLILTCLGTAHI